MFDHIGIFVSDSDRSIPFYEACLEPLGITILQRQPELRAAVFIGSKRNPFLWVGEAHGNYYGTPLAAETHRPMHLAFRASSKEAVDQFYQKAIANGAKDNGAPEDCGGGYYAAYVLDPDGNNLEAGYREK